MSIYQDHTEYLKFRYTSRSDLGEREITYLVPEPSFDRALDEFLSMCVGIYEWSREDVKGKALEAIMEWET